MEERRKRILIVEDEALIAASASLLLTSHGFDVTKALNGDQAILAVRTEPEGVDLILMDIDLGAGKDGTQTAEEILREHDIPILFISSHTEKEIVEKTKAITSYGYVVKDSGDFVLLASIEMAFKLHSAHMQIAGWARAFEHAGWGVAVGSSHEIRLGNVNPAFAAMHGYTMEEMKTKDMSTLVDPASLPRLEETIRASHREDHVGYESVHVRKDGSVFPVTVDVTAIRDARGNVTGRVLNVQDITQRKHSEEALRHSISLLSAALESTADGLLVVDRQGRITHFNRQMASMWNVPLAVLEQGNDAEAIRMITGQLKSPDTFLSKVAELYNTPDASSFDLIELTDGKVFERYSQPQRIDGTPVGRVWSFRDISERRAMEEQLRSRELQMRMLMENSHDLICELDINGIFRYVNTNFKPIVGYGPGDLLGTCAFDKVHPADVAEVKEEFGKAMMTPGARRKAYRFINSAGEYLWFEGVGRGFLTASGEPRAVIVCRDITDRTFTEEQLKHSLREKDILVKEVLHRVKNNLALVASILNIQAEYVVAGKDADLFRETRLRVMAMSRIHEQLYRSGNLSRVDFKAYAEGIIRSLAEAFKNPRVTVRMDFGEVELGIDRSIPLGLILNELVTNSYKYAFPGNTPGEITVECRQRPDRSLYLAVRDNGVGIAAADVANTPGTLGLTLVKLLIEQIEGSMEVTGSPGTSFTVNVPR